MHKSQTLNKTIQIEDQLIHYKIGGSGPFLLMLHGFTLSGEQWEYFIPDLMKKYTVVVVDLPGHGNSQSEAISYSFSRMATLMLELLEALEIPQTFGIGHSAGSIILFHMALQAPEKIKALTLVAFAHKMSEEGINLLLHDKFEDADEEFQRFYKKIHPGGAKQIEAIFKHENALAQHPEDIDFLPEMLFPIQTPVLLVIGDRDFYFPMDFALKTYQNLPKASLWTIPAQNHLPIWPYFGGSEEAQRIFTAECQKFFAAYI
jgi:pimeloyl-ACP methyl ester carboxylesterase